MRNKASNHNKFLRFITIPFRALSKAKDIYVRGLTNCASKGNYANPRIRGPASKMTNLPKSFSARSSNSNESEDLRELIRAASARTMGTAMAHEMDMYIQQQQQQQQVSWHVGPTGTTGRPGSTARSCSVGMSKIDEDKACDNFGEDINSSVSVKADLLYPRSRSYAVTHRSVVGF